MPFSVIYTISIDINEKNITQVKFMVQSLVIWINYPCEVGVSGNGLGWSAGGERVIVRPKSDLLDILIY